MWRWALLGLAACGRLGFEAHGDAAGAGSDARADAAFSTRHWVNRNDGAPGAIISPKLVYDDARGTVILYGGDTTAGVNDTMWELIASGWTKLCGPCTPGKRYLHAMAYDRARDRIVLYGGLATSGDLWEWDGTTWSQPSVTISRNAVSYAQMAYDDARATIVLIGGKGTTTTDDEIEEYDGTTVMHPAPTGGPVNVGGEGAEIAYDTRAHLTYVLPDTAEGAAHDDLWTWDGTSWAQVCATCTGMPRVDASIVYDEALARLYLANGFNGIELSNTWQLDGSMFHVVDANPPPRDSAGMVYDRARDVVVMYGGNGASCGGNCAETWEFVPN
jgi:hypothetical protein